MADLTYIVNSSTGTNSGTSWTTLRGAWDDFKNNNRNGAGTGTVAASSTFYILLDGFTDGTASGPSLTGIDTSNSGAAIVIDGYNTKWNASTSNAAGPMTSKDGIDCGNNQFFVYNFQLGLTIQNIVIKGAGNSTSPTVYGLFEGTFKNCIIECTTAANASAVLLDGFTGNTRTASFYNCTIILSNTAQSGTVLAVKLTAPSKVYQCTIVSLDATGIGTAFNDMSASPIVANTYVGGFGSTPWGGYTYGGTSVGNAGDKSDTPNSGLTSVLKTTTNFQNVTSGSADFRSKAASVLTTTGATRIAAVLTDAYAQSRSATTTIGVFAAEASSTVVGVLTGGKLANSILLQGLVR